jgi:hypothetical protein
LDGASAPERRINARPVLDWSPVGSSDHAEGKDLQTTLRTGGVVIGMLMGLRDGVPLIVFPGNCREMATEARSTVDMTAIPIGSQVAILFEDGDEARPLIIGRIISPRGQPEVQFDSERVTITAERALELRVGQASLIMHADGRITLRGTRVTSQASGANRIRGGSVHLN